MPGVAIGRPSPVEYAPYFARYVDLVPQGDVLELLRRQVDDTARLVGAVGDGEADFRYADHHAKILAERYLPGIRPR